jgi:hypothetical protein
MLYTTTVFPDGTRGYFFPVNNVGSTTSFTTNVGIGTSGNFLGSYYQDLA